MYVTLGTVTMTVFIQCMLNIFVICYCFFVYNLPQSKVLPANGKWVWPVYVPVPLLNVFNKYNNLYVTFRMIVCV